MISQVHRIGAATPSSKWRPFRSGQRPSKWVQIIFSELPYVRHRSLESVDLQCKSRQPKTAICHSIFKMGGFQVRFGVVLKGQGPKP